MTRRQIRLRPIRREAVDLRRFAAAIAALAALAAREAEEAQNNSDKNTTNEERAA